MMNKKALLVSIMCVGTLMASDDNIVLDGVQKRVCSKILGVDDERKSNLTNKNNSICNKNVQNSTQTVHYESMQDKIEDKTPKIQELGKKFDISCSKEYSSTELTKLDVNRKLRIICMEMEYVCIKNFDSAIDIINQAIQMYECEKNINLLYIIMRMFREYSAQIAKYDLACVKKYISSHCEEVAYINSIGNIELIGNIMLEWFEQYEGSMVEDYYV